MLRYIIKRFLLLPVILLVLSAIIFSFNLFLTPADRLAVFVDNPDILRTVDLDELVKKYGLDRPIYIQYWEWLKGVLGQGNLGWSQSARMPVSQALGKYIAATIELMGLSLFWVFTGSIVLGTHAARFKDHLSDQILRVFSTISMAIPEFIFGLILLILLYVINDWFPPGRLSLWATNIVNSDAFTTFTGFYTIDSLLNLRFGIFLNSLRHLLLPSIAIAIGMWTKLFRLMRSSLLETVREEYVSVARAKGLRESVVINKHARINALLPFITQAGLTIIRGLGGAVVVETVFNFRGMGMFLVQAAKTLDFPAILGISMTIGVGIIIVNLLIDIIYTTLDPRVQIG